jgi:mRNA interferase MazF
MATTASLSWPLRGEVWLVDFDPTRGSEIKKTRPALIIQNDTANRYSPITIVAGISSKFDAQRLYPTEVLLKSPDGGLTVDSVVLLNQIRSIDKARLVRRLGKVDVQIMQAVESAIRISLEM